MIQIDAQKAIVSLAAALVCACGAESAGERVVVRDSAGVTIIESHVPAWSDGSGWRLTEQPLLEIGAVDGAPEYQFEEVAAALRLADGKIAVADAGASEIRFYDESGVFTHASGRAGDAPGEYRQLISIGVGPADSLWAYDFGNRRFTVLTSDGAAVRTVSVGGTLSAVGAVGQLPDGSFVVREFWSSGSHSGEVVFGLVREPAAVARLAADGSGIDTVGAFPGREIFVGSEDGRAVMSAPLFARGASVAQWEGRLFVGIQESFEIGLYSSTGELERLIRVLGVDLTISDADVEELIEQDLARVPEARRPMVRQHLESMQMPETRPAYGDLLVDDAGRLWAAQSARWPAWPSYWTVFDVDGGLLGEVELPDRFRLHAVGGDWVLGVWRDEMDVEYVRMYGLVK